MNYEATSRIQGYKSPPLQVYLYQVFPEQVLWMDLPVFYFWRWIITTGNKVETISMQQSKKKTGCCLLKIPVNGQPLKRQKLVLS